MMLLSPVALLIYGIILIILGVLGVFGLVNTNNKIKNALLERGVFGFVTLFGVALMVVFLGGWLD